MARGDSGWMFVHLVALGLEAAESVGVLLRGDPLQRLVGGGGARSGRRRLDGGVWVGGVTPGIIMEPRLFISSENRPGGTL